MREKVALRHQASLGMATILMIVVVLTFTVFGVLSLVSAKSDLDTSREAEEMTVAYYAAEGRVERQLAMLDAALLEGTLAYPENESLEFTEDVQEGQQIQAALGEPAPGRGSRYEMIRYKLTFTEEWIAEENLDK